MWGPDSTRRILSEGSASASLLAMRQLEVPPTIPSEYDAHGRNSASTSSKDQVVLDVSGRHDEDEILGRS